VKKRIQLFFQIISLDSSLVMTYIQNPLSYKVPETGANISPRQLEIIAKASKLLSKKGAEGLTIKNLAKEMKFSEAALYRHFKSKEKIVVALIEHEICQLEDLFMTIDKGMSPPNRYAAFFDVLFRYYQENKNLVDVVFSDGIFEKKPEILEALNGLSNVMQKHLIPIIMDGKLSQDFPMDMNADRIIHILIGTFRLQMQKWSTSDYKFDVALSGNDIMGGLLKLFKK
jgi:TetR/AcrR family transcriptional regulator, fatty acid metabolism regulator protein